MKKKIFYLTLLAFMFLFVVKTNQTVIASDHPQFDLYPLVSQNDASVACDSSFCGIKINPNIDQSLYSFEYKNGENFQMYTEGIYKLKVSTNLNHTYQYRKITVISENFQKEYDVSEKTISINLYLESQERFYLIFEYKISNIAYIKNKPVYDSFKNFSLIKIDSSEDITISKITAGSFWSIKKHLPGFVSDPSSNKIYSYQLFSTNANSTFQAGSYKISFYHNLNSCSQNCSSYEYQKLKVISSNNTVEYLLNYSATGKLIFDFESEENFSLILENKVNFIRSDDYPLDIICNINLVNIKKSNTFISLVESGGFYTVNNESKYYIFSPDINKSYKFVLSNGIANRKYEPGIYKLSFHYDLNSCENNCSSYNYQKINVITNTNTYEHEVSYSINNIFTFEFVSNDYFYLMFENKVSFVREDDYPLDNFNHFSLYKESELIDLTSPVFSDYQGVYISNVDSPVEISEIQNYLTASDETDGDLSNKIIIKEDNYSSNNNKLGLYEIIFSVTDESYNETCIIIKVNVVDISPPIISGTNILVCSIKDGCIINEEQIDLTNINLLFTITDNVDQETMFNIIEDNWSNKEKNINEDYKIVINAVDLSSNLSDNFIITITYFDDIYPLVVSGGEFNTGNSSPLTIELIKENIIVSDNFDGSQQIQSKNSTSIFNLKEDNYSSDFDKVGSYKIIFTYQEIDYQVTINVFDDLPPIFYIEDKIIHIDSFNTLNHEQIIQLLKTLNLISDDLISTSFIIDEYSINANKKGTYNISVSVDYGENNLEIVELTIMIHDQNSNIKPTTYNFLYIVLLSILIILIVFSSPFLIKKVYKFRKSKH